jgi:hypothetical protein
MSFSESFPSECSQHIFSYLKLADCLRFGSTSSDGLIGVLPTLCVRRNRMKQPYAVAMRKDQQCCPSPTSTALDRDDAMIWHKEQPSVKVGLVEELKRENLEMGSYTYTTFPTTQHRVEQLAAKIPPLHPLKGLVQELCKSLGVDLDKEVVSLLSVASSTATLIAALKLVLCPLKLHARILKEALYSERHEGSTELHRYIGDVLCVAHLLYDCNSNCSFAEGSPSPFSLAEAIRQSPSSCYRSWVLMHAGILRTKLFSDHERLRLGIDDLSGTAANDLDTASTMATTSVRLYNRSASTWTLPMDCYRSDAFMASEMVLVYDDFGPLGPSFRGRDIVRVRDLSAHSMLAYFTSIRNEGAASREALEWMCLAHEQTFKARPMSVRTPVVRFC